ncbi:hypothetical protein JCM14469_32370 [Desulfatiferula olefinivorans]
MTISMQGSWTVSVHSKQASWAQRYVIQGSANSVDGEYYDTSPPLFVSGNEWGITIQHNPSGPVSWIQSRTRMVRHRVSAGQFLFDIESNDTGGDEDFNDLILTCAMTLSPADYVVYGTVRSYSGLCPFNPCFPRDFHVIDTPFQLSELLKHKKTRAILEKIYPERVREFEAVKPFPNPDPPPFVPLMIPSGLGDNTGYAVSHDAAIGDENRKTIVSRAQPLTVASGKTIVNIKETAADTLLTQDDRLMLGRIRDAFRVKPCTVDDVSQTLLRFMEYDRTDSEKLGGPYTGEGHRHALGISATDEFGSFLFRFTQSYEQLAQENEDIAAGESLETELRPDVMIQLLNELPAGIMYETAPYYNISNIKRINLCIPSRELEAPKTSCQGGRAIQALGNLSIITDGTTLHSDGTVSNTSSTGPLVSRAAWYGTLDLYACFLDTDPRVTHYTLRYRSHDGLSWSGWNYVSEEYRHPRQQTDGTWRNERIGPDPLALRVNGPSQPKVVVGAYVNIEDQAVNVDWQNWNRDRKLQIHTSLYQSASGQVEFRIDGFDASGEKVAAAQDTIRLFIDNTWTEGDIDTIQMGSADPGECAFFDLPTPGQPLSVRYRATDPEGFMDQYTLCVYRGSNTFVSTKNPVTDAPVNFSYQPVHPFRFHGTLDETLDPSGYVEITLVPSGTDNSWLSTGVGFCAFSFELSARDRKTNGYSTPSNRILWRELVGMSYDWSESS